MQTSGLEVKTLHLSQMEIGKSYEYACLKSLERHLLLTGDCQVHLVQSPSMRIAELAYQKAEAAGEAHNLIRASDAAIRVILRLEPMLEHGSGVLNLSLQADSRGMAGDVRDLVCVRQCGWEMGLSCKHNHHAVKHSRLSPTIDFGRDWFGLHCSHAYFDEINPIFNDLRRMRDDALAEGEPIPLWRDLPDKVSTYYRPILNAFMREMERLSAAHPEVPGRLIRYMMGTHDFYKVITDDEHSVTRVEAVNISGSLNRPVNGYRPIVEVPHLKLPTRFYHIGMLPNSDNTVEIVCDEGWTLTMRIHNASSRIEPSLKFDVQQGSLPSCIHVQVEPW